MTLVWPTHAELDCSLTREFINRKLLLTFHIFPGLHAFISLLHPLPSCSRYHSQALVFECPEPEPCPSTSPVRCLCTCRTLVKATPRSHEPISLCGDTLCSGSTIANVWRPASLRTWPGNRSGPRPFAHVWWCCYQRKQYHVEHKIRQCAFTWVYVFAEMSSHTIQILLSRLLIIWVSMNWTRQL